MQCRDAGGWRRLTHGTYGTYAGASGGRDRWQSHFGILLATDPGHPVRMPSDPKVFSNYFLVRHRDLNHAGTLFGGTMMAWADELAYIAASLSYPDCTFVTKVF